MTTPSLYFLQPDGSADEPQAELGGKTPLQAARTPNLDAMARTGRGVRLRTIPEGYPPGSDVGNLSLLGYDPRRYYTGRAPIEAAAMGIELAADQLAFRCNLVCMEERDDGRVMVDFSAGHIETEEAGQLIAALAPALNGAELHPGVSYRHILVTDLPLADVDTTPPHDIQDQAVEAHIPGGDSGKPFREWAAAARKILADHPVNQARREAGKLPATDVWIWGGGKAAVLPPLAERYAGWTGSMITAVDLLRGIATLAKMENIHVPGATGFIDTDYDGKAAAALGAETDLVFVHLEAPDESSHMGRLDYKIEAIENFDAKIVGPVLARAEETGAAIAVAPDHPTLIRTKTHALADVPCLVWRPGGDESGLAGFDEEIVATCERVDGWELIDGIR